MTEPRTPEEALAAALERQHEAFLAEPESFDSREAVAAAILAALEAQGWRLVSGDRPDWEALRESGYRLDALLDEMVAAGWPGEFDARERAALAKLGYVPRGAVQTVSDTTGASGGSPAAVSGLLPQPARPDTGERRPFEAIDALRAALGADSEPPGDGNRAMRRIAKAGDAVAVDRAIEGGAIRPGGGVTE